MTTAILSFGLLAILVVAPVMIVLAIIELNRWRTR
jgi:hypothetical protein